MIKESTEIKRQAEPGVEQVQAIDPEVILSRVDGDLEFLRELTDLLFESSDELLDELEKAVAAGDAEAVNVAAHTLKGSVGNFGATRAMKLAYELEKMGKHSQLDGAEALYRALRDELNRVRVQLNDLLQD